MIEQLCGAIIQHDEFKADYERLSELYYKLLFKQNNEIVTDACILPLFTRILQAATTFALSTDSKFRKLAYEIAVMCNSIEEVNTNLQFASRIIPLIFTRLGNFPAENKFIIDRNLPSISLPTSLWFEQENHRNENTITIAEKNRLTLTDFQLNLWESANTYPITIVNAPTSAGKSFVLQNHLVNAVASKCRSAIYIVPTRALIDQVIFDFHRILKGLDIEGVVVTSIPECDPAHKTIYVLTQERTQLLLENEMVIDIAVIDEAQNVSDSARGIILQSVVENIKERSVNTKFVFATPFVQNPDVFLNMFSLDRAKCMTIPVGESPVSQNLFSVVVNSQDYHQFDISKLDENGDFSPLGPIYSELELVNEKHYLAILALAVGKGYSNIIYGSEPKKCEDIAQLIMQQLPEEDTNENLMEFSEYIKEHLHKDYLLAETIRHGVAYHYGKLPTFIRKGIERLCSSGDIKFIVCTSTLLQGVNLPAKNVFISKPTKGQDAKKHNIPMNAPDFWNLAGRAGRLTKDFDGNVFLLNLDEWEINPIAEGEKCTLITPSFKKCICEETEQLCQFIEDTNHKSGKQSTQHFENAFMKLYFLEANGQLEQTLENFENAIDRQQKNRIIGLIKSIKATITVPDNIAKKNPNISIYRQQALYDYFCKNLKRIKSFIPQHPMRSSSITRDSYEQLFRVYNHIIANEQNELHKYFWWFSLDWMHGKPYKDLLKDQIEYANKKRRRGQANVNTEARKLFDSIETKLRFDYVKYSKCYNDILTYTLSTNGLEYMVESIPPLHLYLELGASSKTMINLIGLGLSRTAAWILADKIINSDMTTDGVLMWLKKANINALDIPKSVKTEISQIM